MSGMEVEVYRAALERIRSTRAPVMQDASPYYRGQQLGFNTCADIALAALKQFEAGGGSVLPTHFQCAVCFGVFEKGWSDEEAEAENHPLRNGKPVDQCSLVCDVCFQRAVIVLGERA